MIDLENLSQEELISRGLAARSVLSDQTFRDYAEFLKKLYLESIGNTAPDQTKERETLYLQLSAWRDLLGIMESMAASAERAVQNRDSDETELDY